MMIIIKKTITTCVIKNKYLLSYFSVKSEILKRLWLLLGELNEQNQLQI